MLYQLAEHQIAGDWDTESPLDSPEFQTLEDPFYNFETSLVQPPTAS
jgi:hypothetical protein